MRLFLPVLLAGCIPHLYSPDIDRVVVSSDWLAPDNRWPSSAPPAALAGEGWEQGEAVPDVRVTDQFGEEVSLWQFHGQVILLDISTMWCAPCRELAQDTEETAEHFSDEDFVYVTVLQEDVEGNPPTLHDLNLWVEAYEISSPVLDDGDKQTADAVENDQFPAVMVIGRDLRITERVLPANDAEIRRAVEAAL